MKLTFIVHSLCRVYILTKISPDEQKTNQSIFSLDGFIVSQFIQQITMRQAGLSNRHFFKTQITICCRRQILSFSSRRGLNHNVYKCIFIREELDKVGKLYPSILSWGAFQLIYISHWHLNRHFNNHNDHFLRGSPYIYIETRNRIFATNISMKQIQ